MATYSNLTAQQKSDLAVYDTYMRGVFSSLAQLARVSDPAYWNQFAIDRVDPVIATLDPGEVIPNSTGLAGALDVTHEDFAAGQVILRTLKTTLESNLSLLNKLAGAANVS